MPVFSLIQLKSDSIGRENPTYSLGKQLICRWEGLLALLFVDRLQQIEVLLLGEPLFERPVAVGPVSTENRAFDCRQHAPMDCSQSSLGGRFRFLA